MLKTMFSSVTLQVCLDTEETGVLWGEPWNVGGTEYFVVCALRADDSNVLYRFHDNDGDGAPDQSSKVELFSTGTSPAYLTSLSRVQTDDGPEPTLLMLDRRCQDVWVAEDTDQDDWPDTLQAEAFATAAAYPELLDVLGIGAWDSPDGTTLLGIVEKGYINEGYLDAHLLVDSTGDLVADSSTSMSPESKLPTLYGTPFDGQTVVTVCGGFAAHGRTAHIWALNADHEDLSLLGQGTFVDVDKIEIALSRALLLNETIGLRFDDGTRQSIIEVQPAHPQLLGSDPKKIAMDDLVTSQTVLLRGLNLTGTMTVSVLGPDGEVTTVAHTLISDEEATIDLPAYVPGEDPFPYSKMSVWAEAPDQLDEEGATVLRITLSPPSGP